MNTMIMRILLIQSLSIDWKRIERIPGVQIISFDEGTVHNCEYEDTESYKVTEMFINNKGALLERVLSE